MTMIMVEPLASQRIDMDRRTIGLRMRELREARSLTQFQLATAIGVTQTAVTLWEAGKREPSATLLFAAADALEVDVNEFRADPTTEYDPRGRGRPPAPKPPEEPPTPTRPRPKK